MYFPVAFQVLFLALLAGFGWGANLLLLARAGVKVRPILQLSHQQTRTLGNDDDDRLHKNVFRLTRSVAGIAASGWLVCALLPPSRAQACVILLTYSTVAGVLLMPQNALCRSTRRQFTASLFRIVNPTMSSPVFLSDIIMADILTSCARMFSDIYLVACSVATAFYFQGDNASPANAGSDVDKLASAVRTALKKTTCKDAGAIGVLLVAAPYAFRLRQCVNEYLKASSGSSDAKRHAANAVKYASAFPMICLFAAQKKITASKASDGYADWALNAAFGMWIVSVAFNSLYSFYWDIAFDWDLSHFADGWKLSDLVSPTQRSASENSTGDYIDAPEDDSSDKAHALASSDALERQDADQLASVSPGSEKPHDFPALLRPNLCFSSSKFYYSAIVVDFFLRIVWTLKLSSYIQIDMLAYSGFWLNVLEIYRRWQWTFLRIEKEAATAPI